MEIISWTDLLGNEKVIQEPREEEYPRHDKKGTLNGLVSSCVGTAFSNTFLKERSDGKMRKKS